jgi:Ni,Fe-hydrogenase I large subunit
MQPITRRVFLYYCTGAAASLGLTAEDLLGLREALANPLGPAVIWLQGSGCSVSFLNYVGRTPPNTVEDVLFGSVNLIYHPVEVLGVIHSFDPCLACAMHVVRPVTRGRFWRLYVNPLTKESSG